MAMPMIELNFTGDPAPFCCPVCGHQIYTEKADGSFCKHVVFSLVDLDMQRQCNNYVYESAFMAVAKSKVESEPEWDGDVDEFLDDLGFDETTELVPQSINSPSAFMFKVATYGTGCCGPIGSAYCAVVDFLPQS
ncbi:hypothetical protein [Desulfuromonas thiophila]|uniref:hypothetical protein n=1 Tax=Desulfuromonas thiophila TaxID=57664 RepID=UPI0029F51390|nr:hypothetical protein [Desulfuromonas thiophila]